mgnify:CR=1 FL=1
MAIEQPLNLDAFFMSRNEIANRHGGKLELQALARVREHMVEESSKQRQTISSARVEQKPNANQDKKEK